MTTKHSTATVDDLTRHLEDCTSQDDLCRVIVEIEQAKSSLTSQLDHALSSGQVSLEHALDRVELSQSQLAPALNMSHELAAMLSSASQLAFRISSRVRGIDGEHGRVKACLSYVENTILLRSCVLGMQDAMDIGDWERAASYINKSFSLPKELVNGDFAKSTVPTSEIPEQPSVTIKKAAELLGDKFVKQFNKAASTKDMENVTRYFKLFPLIGQESEGLDLYAKFVSGIITALSRDILQQRPMADNIASANFYGLAMSRLFENIALIVSQHAPVVDRHYGPGKMMRVLNKIQDEADSQGGLIIDTFWDERRIDRVMTEIKSYSFPSLVNSFTMTGDRSSSPNERVSMEETEGLNLKELGNLVNEMSVMLHRWALYKKFLASRWREVDPSVTHDDDSVSQNIPATHGMSLPSIVVNCGLSHKVEHRMATGYECLATFVLRRSVEKAFELEEIPDVYQRYSQETPLITSAVDDIMYIYNTLLQQTLASGDISIIKAVFTDFRRILESDFTGMIQRKLRDLSPKQGLTVPVPSRSATPTGTMRGSKQSKNISRGLAGLANADDKKLRTFLIYLNNLSVTPDYADRMFKNLSVEDDLPFNDDASNVKGILDSLSKTLRTRCLELLSDGVSVVFYVVLNARLRSICTTIFNKANYIQSPDQQALDISQEFSFEWHQLMDAFSNVMAPDIFDRLISIAAQVVSQSLEKFIWGLNGRISELGAIALDRDMSRIIATVSEGRYRMREKFVRVAQIVMLIGMEEGDEEDPEITWSLKYDERVKARKMKI